MLSREAGWGGVLGLAGPFRTAIRAPLPGGAKPTPSALPFAEPAILQHVEGN